MKHQRRQRTIIVAAGGNHQQQYCTNIGINIYCTPLPMNAARHLRYALRHVDTSLVCVRDDDNAYQQKAAAAWRANRGGNRLLF